MTSTVSFKDKFKQAFSIFRWDFRACTGTLTVFGILATVFCTIILTICLVCADSAEQFYSGTSYTGNQGVDPFGTGIKVFQFASAIVLYLMTTVFTIFYTVRVFSYLHNKRKADMYGSLPISRTTLYLTKAASAYILSIVPTLFFLGIISIISICCGVPLVNDVSALYLKIIIGALASISAYGLISVCCGTTFNSVVMFITVCIAYPLSAIFIKGTIGGFFKGFYSGIFQDNFIMNALNPLAAYDGINVIYWIIFSIVCNVGAAFLIKRRKAERAQSSFAFYLPCHIVKVLVAFLSGMFLGTLFGSLNVLGNGFLGFVFGFILGSIPAFIIAHLIFYKGFSKLIKTSIPLGGLIVFVIAGIAICNFDVFGYNTFVPNADNIKSAGFYSRDNTYLNSDENFKNVINDMADDFSDKEMKGLITSLHNKIIDDNQLNSQKKFANVWVSIFSDNFLFPNGFAQYAFSYKMNNGTVVTRVYSENSYYYTPNSSYLYGIDEYVDVVTNRKYVQKYSALTKADNNDIYQFFIAGRASDGDGAYNRIVDSSTSLLSSTSGYADCQRIRDAVKKDIEQNNDDWEKVISVTANEMSPNYCDFYDYYEDNEDGLAAFDQANKEYSDIVCMLNLEANNTNYSDDFTFFSPFPQQPNNYSYAYEVYMIPKSYKNTISVLQDIGILKKDLSLDKNSPYKCYSTDYSFYY